LAKLSVQKRFPHRIATDDAQTLCVIERVVDQLEVKVRLLAALLISINQPTIRDLVAESAEKMGRPT
jgi:hypothetical protein